MLARLKPRFLSYSKVSNRDGKGSLRDNDDKVLRFKIEEYMKVDFS